MLLSLVQWDIVAIYGFVRLVFHTLPFTSFCLCTFIVYSFPAFFSLSLLVLSIFFSILILVFFLPILHLLWILHWYLYLQCFFCFLLDWPSFKFNSPFLCFFYPHTTWKNHIECHSYLCFLFNQVPLWEIIFHHYITVHIIFPQNLLNSLIKLF